MTFDQFITQWSGKGCDFDGYYGFQCMDLAHQYATDVVGKDFAPAPAAKDVWNQNINGYTKITNSSDNFPLKGDIVIWGTGVGAYGHIAVAISGDKDGFVSFDQNWPVGTVCHTQQHNYTGVLGWFHPNTVLEQEICLPQKTFEGLVTKSTKYDQFVTAGYSDPQAINDKIANFNAENNKLSTNVNNLQQQVDKLAALNEQQATKINDLNNELITLQSKPEKPAQTIVVNQNEKIKPLVNSGWLVYIKSRQAIRDLVNS